MARRRGWDPITDLVTMQQAMEQLYNDAWGRRSSGWRQGERVASLPVDVYSTADEVILQASVPGVNPQDVEITIEGETLTIQVEFQAPLDNVDYHIQERGYGRFARTLTLNLPVQVDQAEAVFDKGVLTLTIPKAEKARPKVIKVKSK